MGVETQFVLRNNICPALNLCNQASHLLPKHSGGMGIDRHSHSKRENLEKRKEVIDPKQVQNLVIKLYQLLKPKNNPLWFDTLPFRPTGVAAPQL